MYLLIVFFVFLLFSSFYCIVISTTMTSNKQNLFNTYFLFQKKLQPLLKRLQFFLKALFLYICCCILIVVILQFSCFRIFIVLVFQQQQNRTSIPYSTLLFLRSILNALFLVLLFQNMFSNNQILVNSKNLLNSRCVVTLQVYNQISI